MAGPWHAGRPVGTPGRGAVARHYPPPCRAEPRRSRSRRPAVRLPRRRHLRALLVIGKDFHGLTSFNKELLASILLIGALAANKIADRIGRRPPVPGTAALLVAEVMLAALLSQLRRLAGAPETARTRRPVAGFSPPDGAGPQVRCEHP